MFQQIVNQLNANQLQMASNLSLANEFIVNLIQMQPIYTQFCISSVERAVQNKINAMKIEAEKCQKCKECAGQGFIVPPFVNNSCPIPEGVGSVLISTFNQASSYLATLESDWQIYRDDAKQKYNYLSAKAFLVFSKYVDLELILDQYRGNISFPFDKINANVIWAYYKKFLAPLTNFANSIDKFDNYFMSHTDQFIILSNQKLKNVFISNWNNTECRDGLFYFFYDSINTISLKWDSYMTSLFYISDVDTELSAVFSEISNFSFSAENCVNGNSNATVLCLNQVRIFSR